jgi:tRNA nucleotidyltransferase (CCA-adding enzyme)
MRIYRVGGAVRDRLLGLPVQDIDWVVVGATAAEMKAAGYQPVGKDFPVFLHPQTRQEYALARTERKSGHGYKGFVVHASPEVTLEEDLLRRDLTINAMAEDEHGQLIDPYHGQADLAAGVLRHVSPAFAEDPVRILRLARFAARFGFSVAPETEALMLQMVEAGEVDHLVPERIWQEISRGLMEKIPSRMFTLLRRCGALARIAPELDALFGVPERLDYHPEGDAGAHTLLVVDAAARHGLPLSARFAALCHDLGKALTPDEMLPRHIGHDARGREPINQLCERWRVPVECRELALLACREHVIIHRARELRPTTLVDLFQRADAWRRPERFDLLLEVCRADACGRQGQEETRYPQAGYLQTALSVANSIDVGAIARACTDKRAIADVVRAARAAALEASGLRYQSP